MKRHFRTLLAGTAICALLNSAALADTISFTGTVAAKETVEIYAPVGGTIASVEVEPGQSVRTGDVLATFSTEKVYAPEAGIVTGLFGLPGDRAETVAEHYGAVLYIEGESVYTISASTENAYNKTENKFVHVGEQVYLSCYSDGSHTGTGVITAINGADYTVDVLSGEFLVGETVSIFRGESTASSSRIGRGTLNRKNPVAVTAEGSIVSFAVANGDSVERGDLLFETLSGSFDGFYMSGSTILAAEDGVVASINLQQGAKVDKGSVAAVLYPEGSMRVEAQVEETNLNAIAVGDSVSIELIWNQDEEISYPGIISMISAIPVEGESANGADENAVAYAVYADFTPDADTRYGMSAVVTTLDDEAEEGMDDDDL